MPAAVAEVFISRAFDASFGVLTHGCLPIPPAPKFSVSVERLATNAWSAGMATGANQLTSKELQNGVPFCLGGHDLGPLIPDITTMFPPNANYAIMWPFSSRKIMFQSTIVKTEGKDTACAQPAMPIPFPMMTCGDPIGAPVIIAMTNFIANTKIGISGGDIIGGVVKIAAAVAIDLIFNAIGSAAEARQAMRAVMSEAGEAATKSLTRQVLEGIGGKLVPTSWTAAAKAGVSALVGLGISSLEGNPTFELKIGGGLVGEAAVGYGQDGFAAGVKPLGQDIGASTAPAASGS
jgi:hypothetical protein